MNPITTIASLAILATVWTYIIMAWGKNPFYIPVPIEECSHEDYWEGHEDGTTEERQRTIKLLEHERTCLLEENPDSDAIRAITHLLYFINNPEEAVHIENSQRENDWA